MIYVYFLAVLRKRCNLILRLEFKFRTSHEQAKGRLLKRVTDKSGELPIIRGRLS